MICSKTITAVLRGELTALVLQTLAANRRAVVTLNRLLVNFLIHRTPTIFRANTEKTRTEIVLPTINTVEIIPVEIMIEIIAHPGIAIATTIDVAITTVEAAVTETGLEIATETEIETVTETAQKIDLEIRIDQDRGQGMKNTREGRFF